MISVRRTFAHLADIFEVLPRLNISGIHPPEPAVGLDQENHCFYPIRVVKTSQPSVLSFLNVPKPVMAFLCVADRTASAFGLCQLRSGLAFGRR